MPDAWIAGSGPSRSQVLGVAGATAVGVPASQGLPAGVSYAAETMAGDPVHAHSAVLLLAGTAVPLVLWTLFLLGRRGALVGVPAVLAGVVFVVLAQFVFERATLACDASGTRVPACVDHPWWLGSEVAAVAYVAGGIGLAVAGVLALRA
ncbi:hypothetical protein BRD00_13565 [Halobacteriales archaeon QS_8_69_26]|nr:MAG: hypothetical protein BRD00_13565 [Halobacteriales archaeon QS_8_69_26]